MVSWCPTDDELHFISLSITHRPISVSSSLTIDSTLNVIAYHGEETVTLSLTAINDIRQIELILSEISIEKFSLPKVLSSSNSVQLHITKACKHINHAIIKLEESISGSFDKNYTSNDTSTLARLQFNVCQVENATIPKNRRRFNILTQVLALKSHLVSPSCYNYLQSLECLALPHFYTLEKLYSSIGFESDYISYLNQATANFSPQKRNLIVQMDEIHVTSDVSYKGGRIIGSCIKPEDPIRTVFAIMASSLQKMVNCCTFNPTLYN